MADLLTVDGITLPVITRDRYSKALATQRKRVREAASTVQTVGGVVSVELVEREPGPIGFIVERHQAVLRYWVGPHDAPETWLGFALKGEPWWTARVARSANTTRSFTSPEAALRGCRRKLGRAEA